MGCDSFCLITTALLFVKLLIGMLPKFIIDILFHQALEQWIWSSCGSSYKWKWASLVAQLVSIHLQCRIPGSGRYPGEGIGYPLQYSWASLVVQLVKNPPAMQETWVWSLGWEDPLEKGKEIPWRIFTPVFWPGEFMDCIVHGVTKSQTQLSDFHFHKWK